MNKEKLKTIINDKKIIINKFRMYINEIYISDITKINGDQINKTSYNVTGKIRNYKFPNKKITSLSSLPLWKHYIKKCTIHTNYIYLKKTRSMVYNHQKR